MDKRIHILITCAAIAACGVDNNHEKFGSVDVTATAPTIEKGFTTGDGWAVKFDRFVVSMSAISISASDNQVVTATAAPQLFDAVAAAPTGLLSSTVRFARQWDTFTFQIAPAIASEDTPITLASSVKDADRDLMTKGGLSIYLEGKASKGAVTKTMKWGFTTDTTFTDCEGELGGRMVKGVVIVPDGGDVVDLAFRGDVLFSDNLAAPGVVTRFDAFAAADADTNGEITLDELAATTLEAARTIGAPYNTAGNKDVADLGGFTSALTRQILASYRAKGTCTATVTPAAAP